MKYFLINRIINDLRYQQHTANLIGRNSGCIARFRHLDLMLFGRYRQWNTRNIEALSNLREKLTPENHSIYDEFFHFRNVLLWSLAALFKRI